MSYKYEFNLTLTIHGDRLEDIDNGLVAAAGERLRARMTNPPTINGADVLRKQAKERDAERAAHDNATAHPDEAEPTVVIPDPPPQPHADEAGIPDGDAKVPGKKGWRRFV